MDALELIVLGRQLSRVGERVLRGGDLPGHQLAAGRRLVMSDVMTHPGSPIGKIAARTELPQSYVSESVQWMRDRGLARTSADPADRRRTLVRIAGEHTALVAGKGTRDARDALLAALGDIDAETADRLIGALGELALRLRPAQAGPVLSQLRARPAGDPARSDQEDGQP
jgi:DNA-binding MarR family transcriptional regulator